MRRTSEPRFDVATVTDCGARPYQQDALVANFSTGEEIGIGVLADGMGGHDGGDVASALVVGRAFAEIRAGFASGATGAVKVGPVLREAVDVANDAVRTRIEADRNLRGMGSTLVACLTIGPDLHWVSVGDSPLYLVRDGLLEQLNEDHSMRPQIEAMAATGMIDAELARNHPDRNQLLSAICGRAIDHVDCRDTPFALRLGDVVIAASDGLQTLSDDEIRRIVASNRQACATDIAQALMQAVKKVALPDQDNVAIMAIKVLSDRPLRTSEPLPRAEMIAPAPAAEEPAVFDAVPIDDAPKPPDAAPAESLERAPDDLERALAL